MTSSGLHLVVHVRTLAAVALLPVLAGACVPDDALTPRAPNTLDAALADVTHPALDVVAALFSGAGVITPTIIPSRCPLESTSQTFVCSPLSGGGLTLTQRFALLDARGAKQSSFDPATTAGLHLENAVTGTSVQQGTTVDGQQRLDLTGLGSARHTLNGSSLTRTNANTRKITITDLVIPVVPPSQPIGWPLSGTVDIRMLSADATTEEYFVTMRFSGSTIVDITSTQPGGAAGATLTCQLDIRIFLGGGLGCPLVTPGGGHTDVLPVVSRQALAHRDAPHWPAAGPPAYWTGP